MFSKFEDPRKAFGDEVTRLAAEDDRIIAISADSGGGSGFSEFAKKYPDRFFEVGIAEQVAVGLASGCATTGKIPVFAAIAPFVTARPYEMFRNDLGYMMQNAKIVGRNGGITYSDLGATHYSLDDFGIMRMIPGNVILCPQDPAEIRAAVRAMMRYVGPVYMRIGNGAIASLFDEGEIEIGKGRLIQSGSDVTVVSTGATTANVVEALSTLKDAGISAELIGLGTVWPLDEEMILRSAKKTGRVVTVEEHFIGGGLGTMVSDLLSEKLPTPVKKLGIPNEYAVTGPYEDILTYYGLDAAGIAASIKAYLK